MTMPARIRLLSFLSLGALLALGLVLWLQPAASPRLEVKATLLPNSPPLPEFTLEGPRGGFTRAQLAGQWSFVFFGYTQCPDVCPTTLQLMREVKARVATHAGAQSFQVVFVSVDPKRDTRELLDQYTAAFDPAFIALRGDDAGLQPLQRALGVFFQRNDSSDKAHYTVDHSAGLYLIGPEARLVAYFSQPHQAEAIVTDFLRIATAAR